jgi:hypothetical protein
MGSGKFSCRPSWKLEYELLVVRLQTEGQIDVRGLKIQSGKASPRDIHRGKSSGGSPGCGYPTEETGKITSFPPAKLSPPLSRSRGAVWGALKWGKEHACSTMVRTVGNSSTIVPVYMQETFPDYAPSRVVDRQSAVDRPVGSLRSQDATLRRNGWRWNFCSCSGNFLFPFRPTCIRTRRLIY